MSSRLDRISIGQQLALVASGFCLLVSMAIVGLAAVSSQYMQLAQQEQFGSALAQQIARRISTTLETGDLLSVAASLQRFVQTSSAEEVAIFDVEGKAIGQAGTARGQSLQQYQAAVLIEDDMAGQVVITMSNDNARATHRQLLLSLCGLSFLLSVAVFGVTRYLGQRLAARLGRLSEAVALEDAAPSGAPLNELARLEAGVESLPMDLLRTRTGVEPSDENYRTTAVLYLHLTSLANYVDTLDHDSLLAYTHRLHQAVYAAAGFYSGQLQVVRQFGLALYFCGDSSADAASPAAGTPAFRAAACGWLVQSVCASLEQEMSLSLSIAMAIDQSELGAGNAADIYPGLYIQHTLDELHSLCASKPPKILLSPAVCADIDVEGRLVQNATELRDYGMLDEFAAPYQDLLERQLRLILRRLGDSA